MRYTSGVLSAVTLLLVVASVHAQGALNTPAPIPTPPLSDPVTVVRALIGRYWPEHVDSFELELIPKCEGDMYFLASSTSGPARIHIGGTSAVSMASGLYYYLTHFVQIQPLSWHQLEVPVLPAVLPTIPLPISKHSSMQYNYYMNVCTQSYSMVWWSWPRWQRELDWMALHGINIALAFTGQEKVWQQVYTQLGLSLRDLDDFFAGPAFLTWQRMGNMQGSWSGALPQDWIDSQAALQVQIVTRMRQFGMTVVLPAFSGHVPHKLAALFPSSNITRGTNWNGFQSDPYCCAMLLAPDDPLFVDIGTRFIQAQTVLYGTDHIYNTDTFNENQPSSNSSAYLTAISGAVYRSMTQADPQAVWLMQGWLFTDTAFWNPQTIKSLLDGVPNTGMILLDLFSDVKPFWNISQSYYGKPYIWCMLHDFGGNNGMYGQIPTIASAPTDALHYPGSTMIGIGLTPEGINQNEIMYDMMTDTYWRNTTLNVSEWMDSWLSARYRTQNSVAREAWEIMSRTVYASPGQWSVTKSFVEILPELEMNRTSFMPTDLYYDAHELEDALQLLLSASDTLGMVEAYRYDLVDLCRQVLSNRLIVLHDALVAQYRVRSSVGVTQAGQQVLQLIVDMDTLLASHPHFLLGRWLADAEAAAPSLNDTSLFTLNARNQITWWGPTGEIIDYASKQWSGLIRDFYLPRWELFVETLVDCVQHNTEFDADAFAAASHIVEGKWQLATDTYPDEPVGDSIGLVYSMVKKYLTPVHAQPLLVVS